MTRPSAQAVLDSLRRDEEEIASFLARLAEAESPTHDERAQQAVFRLLADELDALGFAVRRLPDIHRDPFDRMLSAQTLERDLTLMTTDARIRQYDVATMQA